MSKDDLGAKLAQRTAAPAQASRPKDTVVALLERYKAEIARAVPQQMNPDRLARVVMTAIRTNRKLLQCDQVSLIAAIMLAAQLGLEPGPLGHCYLVPFRNTKTGALEVQFIIGYRGMLDLARRSGTINSIVAREVYENDILQATYGLDDRLVHIPWHLREDKKFESGGELRGCYLVVHFRDGGHFVHYMPRAEIEAHRKRSKAADEGPWNTDYVEMAKKTVVRSAWKWLPLSVEAMRAEVADESVRKELAEDMLEVPNEIDAIDVEPIPKAEPESTVASGSFNFTEEVAQ